MYGLFSTTKNEFTPFKHKFDIKNIHKNCGMLATLAHVRQGQPSELTQTN